MSQKSSKYFPNFSVDLLQIYVRKSLLDKSRIREKVPYLLQSCASLNLLTFLIVWEPIDLQ